MKSKTTGSRRKERQKKNVGDPNTKKSALREWLEAFLYAATVALILKTFFFDAFRIPTPSMEDSLLTGDFLIVSKLHYGIRTPMSVSVPFTEIHIPNLTLPWFRIPGFSSIKRNDVFVFNYPVEDKVISARTHYIKRAVGMPGDTLEITNKMLKVNGQEIDEQPGIQFFHEVFTSGQARISPTKIAEAGGSVIGTTNSGSIVINMTKEEAAQVSTWPEVELVQLYVNPSDYNLFGQSSGFYFSKGIVGNTDQFPPVVIPYEGQQIILTPENYHLYRDILTRYEGNIVLVEGDEFIINGERTNTYTIKQNYYFAMGDNRDNSEDSRFWGFVPDDHVVGKAVMLYFSWDAERFLPRFGRIFNLIR
jgi:signal peptidase I